MKDQTDHPTASNGSASPPGALAFLGDAPLVAGEQPASYDELLARISGALKPADIIEEFWIRDLADLVWDLFRLRHFKAGLLTRSAREGVRSMLWNTMDEDDANELTRKWVVRDETAGAKVKAALASAGVTLQGITAREMLSNISHLEQIERMIMAAESRRHNVLRQLDLHRASLAQRLRRAPSVVEDASLPMPARNAGVQSAAS